MNLACNYRLFDRPPAPFLELVLDPRLDPALCEALRPPPCDALPPCRAIARLFSTDIAAKPRLLFVAIAFIILNY